MHRQRDSKYSNHLLLSADITFFVRHTEILSLRDISVQQLFKKKKKRKREIFTLDLRLEIEYLKPPKKFQNHLNNNLKTCL